MQQAIVTITDPVGLHARPAAVVVQTAGRYQAHVFLHLESVDRHANARSIMQLLNLGVRQGDIVKVVAEGDDALEALEAVLLVLQGVRSAS